MGTTHEEIMARAGECFCGLCDDCKYAQEYAIAVVGAIKRNELIGVRIPMEWRQALTMLNMRTEPLQPHLQRAQEWAYQLVQIAKPPYLVKLRGILGALDKALLILRIASVESTEVVEERLRDVAANAQLVGYKSPVQEALLSAADELNRLRRGSIQVLLRAHKQLKRYSETDPMAQEIEQYFVSLQECMYCHGNDRNMPCAYPGEGKPGCLRDKRLACEGSRL
jgi:hypothetical protein